MKKKSVSIKVLLLVFTLLSSTFSIAIVGATADSWATMEPMPTARGSLGVAVVDGKIYAIGGWNGSYLSINEMYDPATDTWTTKQSMPTARHSFAIGVYQNKIYFIGGIFDESNVVFSGYTGVNEVYDPSADAWETMEPMPTARSELQANVVDNKIYLIGGIKHGSIWPFSQDTDCVNEVYDPLTDSWSTKTPAAPNIPSYPSVVVDNKIYLIGSTFLSYIPTQIYNPETDAWSNGKTKPTPVCRAAAGATTGELAPKRIYVFGGEVDANVVTNLTQIYDPETDTWSTGAPMPTPRHALGVAVVNDLLYAIGGYDVENYRNENEQYTPADYIPEFPSWTVLPLLIIVLLAIIIYKKRLSKTLNQQSYL